MGKKTLKTRLEDEPIKKNELVDENLPPEDQVVSDDLLGDDALDDVVGGSMNSPFPPSTSSNKDGMDNTKNTRRRQRSKGPLKGI